MKNKIQTAAAKQEYQAPKLSDLGLMTQVTLDGASADTDANSAFSAP